MSQPRPFVLTIAGFDPSAGAGILADIKTFEMLDAYGLAVCTSITFQHENYFEGLEWMSFSSIQKQLQILLLKYHIDVIKIGLIESFTLLDKVLELIFKYNHSAKIIWDPILKASAGFDFHQHINQDLLESILGKLFLVTPNLPEAAKLTDRETNSIASALLLNKYCNVYLKGGHSATDNSNDILFINENQFVFESKRIQNISKHGSGCVLSAAIAAYLARGNSLVESCEKAKTYINQFLKSNTSLLGYHKQNTNSQIQN